MKKLLGLEGGSENFVYFKTNTWHYTDQTVLNSTRGIIVERDNWTPRKHASQSCGLTSIISVYWINDEFKEFHSRVTSLNVRPLPETQYLPPILTDNEVRCIRWNLYLCTSYRQSLPSRWNLHWFSPSKHGHWRRTLANGSEVKYFSFRYGLGRLDPQAELYSSHCLVGCFGLSLQKDGFKPRCEQNSFM